MLHSARKLQGFRVIASDGAIGEIADLYFDDEHWTIRYLIVDTGGWLTGRKVLISPLSCGTPQWDSKEVRVQLTRQQVQDSPDIDSEKPISRQQEEEFYRHYDYPLYWVGPLLWGFGAFPALRDLLQHGSGNTAAAPEPARQASSHLRSVAEVVGYHIRATDDPIGHVEDFLFDDRDWSVRLMLVATRNWWPGRHVLISPLHITSVSWPERHVHVSVNRDAIENSPQYDPEHPPDGDGGLYRDSGGPPP